MASAFGHAAAAIGLGSLFKKPILGWKFILLGILCSVFPDIDVIGYQFNVPYESFWGHRGFTHSIFFALIFAFLICLLFYSKLLRSRSIIWLFLYFFLCTISHALLDALTSGGLGVAFFSPFENGRYFLPWQPIKVSPIGVKSFF